MSASNDLEKSGTCTKCGAFGFSGDVHNVVVDDQLVRCGTFVAPQPAPVNRFHVATDHTPSKITQALITQIVERDLHGRKKYGVTLDRDDLTPNQWLQHMAEELMDGAGYALAAKREFVTMLDTIIDKAHTTVSGGVSSAEFHRGVEAVIGTLRHMLCLREAPVPVESPLPLCDVRISTPPKFRETAKLIDRALDTTRAGFTLLNKAEQEVAERTLRRLIDAVRAEYVK